MVKHAAPATAHPVSGAPGQAARAPPPLTGTAASVPSSLQVPGASARVSSAGVGTFLLLDGQPRAPSLHSKRVPASSF